MSGALFPREGDTGAVAPNSTSQILCTAGKAFVNMQPTAFPWLYFFTNGTTAAHFGNCLTRQVGSEATFWKTLCRNYFFKRGFHMSEREPTIKLQSKSSLVLRCGPHQILSSLIAELLRCGLFLNAKARMMVGPQETRRHDFVHFELNHKDSVEYPSLQSWGELAGAEPPMRSVQ